MKYLPISFGCILAVAIMQCAPIVLAGTPPGKEATTQSKVTTLTPAELRQRIHENNNAVGALFRELSVTCQSGRQLQEKLKPRALETARKILDYLKIPENEGRPTYLSPSAAHWKIGETFTRPFNLHLVKEARGHFEEALRLATTPKEKAEARYSIAALAIRSGQENVLEQSEKELMALYEDKSLPVQRRLDLMRDAVEYDLLPDLDFDTLGWKIAEPEPAAHFCFYEHALRLQTVANRKNANKLEDRYSEEHTVEICNRAIQDPAIRDKRYFLGMMSNTLFAMRRYDQAEQLLLENAATTNATARHDNNLLLGDLYVKMARRYYDSPDRPTMEKALVAYSVAKLACPKKTDAIRKIATTALQIGDFDQTISACDDVIRLERTTNRWVSICLGDAYFGKKDWEKAVVCYGPQTQYLPVPSIVKYCQSLYALGRYEETLENLKLFERKGHSSQRDEARYIMQKVEKRMKEPALAK